MTEAEWNACGDPKLMLEFLGNSASDRKLRLFTCACCSRLPRPSGEEKEIEYLFAGIDEELIAHLEALADGEEDEVGLLDTYEKYCGVLASQARDEGFTRLVDLAGVRVRQALEALVHGEADTVSGRAADAVAFFSGKVIENIAAARRQECRAQADLLRCVVGDPFQDMGTRVVWRTTTVVSLAKTIYYDRVFDRLPILADALEEAGCADEAILGHLRGPGPHVRGCWVVDLLLGKE